jgi:phosphate transporter
MCLGLTLT